MARHPDELVGIDCIPCTVPGNVELDLSAAGILPEDLFKGENILQAERYETYEWWYETQFDGVIARVGEKITLEFEGVDCIAEYYLNVELIGKSDNPQWILHSSDQHGNPDRVNLMVNQLRQMFAYEPDNLEEFCYYSQLSQAEAKKYFIERIRIMSPKSGGVIWWNLIDGWPQMSDAVVDYSSFLCSYEKILYMRIFAFDFTTSISGASFAKNSLKKSIVIFSVS